MCGTYVNWIPPVQTKEQRQKSTMMDPGNDEEDSEVVLGKLCSVVHAKLWLLSFCVFPWTSFLFFFDVEWYLNHVFEVTQTLPPATSFFALPLNDWRCHIGIYVLHNCKVEDS